MRRCLQEPNRIDDVPRDLLLLVWTFLEITSWKIELPQVSQAWAAASRSVKATDKVYQETVKLQMASFPKLFKTVAVPIRQMYATPGFGLKKVTVFSDKTFARRLSSREVKLSSIPGWICAGCLSSSVLTTQFQVKPPADMDVLAWFMKTGAAFTFQSQTCVRLCERCLEGQPTRGRPIVWGARYCVRESVTVQGVRLALVVSCINVF